MHLIVLHCLRYIILIDLLMNTIQSLKIMEKIPNMYETKLNLIANQIITKYPEGIHSLMKTRDPEDDNLVYLFMMINTPVDFYMKYCPSDDIGASTHQTELMEVILDQQYQIEERVRKSIEQNKQFESDIISVFERFDVMSSRIVTIVHKNYKKILKEKLRKENEDLYSQSNAFYHQCLHIDEDYYEFSYEDFLIVFCSIINHYSGLLIHFKFSIAERSKGILMLYTNDEKQFENLAEFFNVELQFKPYALAYHNLKQQRDNKNKEFRSKDDDNVLLNEQLLSHSNSNDNKSKQIEDYSINSPIYWPPYYTFKKELKDKYRNYGINDDFCDNYTDNEQEHINPSHSDVIDINTNLDDERTKINPLSYSIPNKPSKFRNIDKLRLIIRITDYLIKFSYLTKRKIVDQVIYKRNNTGYAQFFSSNYIQPNTLDLFDPKENKKRIYFLRNYFGETMAFYFLWVETYLKWLILPVLCGLLLKSMSLLYHDNFTITIYDTSISLNSYDMSLIFFGFFLSLWAALFIKSWKQYEKFYSYLWGTENYERNNPFNEKFESDIKEELIFGYFCLKETRWKHKLKKYASYCVLGLMIVFICLFVLGEFHLKSKLLKGIESYDKNVSLLLATTNAIQIKIMNFVYNKVARQLNKWENHKTQRNNNYSYAIKGILFEFVNNYASLLYIAFIKSSNGVCHYNNCFNEIEMQLYTLFVLTLVLYGVEIGLPFINQSIKKKQRSVSIEQYQSEIKLQSIDHLLLCDSAKTLIDDYKTVIILFGFVCLFSAAAPLTPLIVFLLLLIGRTIDHYKYSNLVRVDFLDEAKGIEIYNHVIKFIVFIGMVINVAILLFASPSATSDAMKQFGLSSKMSLFFFAENIIVMIMIACHWNVLPTWFKKVSVIKELYVSRMLLPQNDKDTMQFSQKNKSLN